MKWFFLDTNVLIYARDPRAPEKQQRAIEWIDALAEREAAVISPQVVLELGYALRRKFRDADPDRIMAVLGALEPWCRAPATYHVFMKGLALHIQTGYQVPDCTMLASALEAGCSVFLSEDMKSGHIVEGMLILNPFVTDVAAFLSNN